MAEEHEIENALPDRSEDESLEVDTPDDEPVEEETGAMEEVEIDSEEPEEELTAEDLSELGDEGAPSPTMEEFVDFNVWVATLEANFGMDFEKVLHDSLGPDWNTQFGNMMMTGENFYRVVQDIKKDIESDAEGVLDEEHLSFETLGAGEVIGETEREETIEGGEIDSIPLADLRRGEFIAQDQFKLDTRPEDYEYEKVLRFKGDKDEEDRQDEVVLVDRSDFEHLSYYAHKEKERRPDDLSMEKLLKRDSLIRLGQYKKKYLVMVSVTGALFLYALLSVVSYFACGVYSRGLLKKFPPDLVFRSSTALHKQGELAGFNSADQRRKQPLIYYTLRPTLQKLVLASVGSGVEEQFELAVCKPSLLVVPKGSRQDSITVRKHYRQFLPSNLGGLVRKPYLSLTEGETIVLNAYETAYSSLLPGLLQLEITDGQGSLLGRAYAAGDKLYILLDGLQEASGGQLKIWNLRLVFLFSLLQI